MPRAVRYKNDPNYQPPKRRHYICHCEQVGEEEIADAIFNRGARTLLEVVELTHAMQSCNHATAELVESACCYEAFRAACQKCFDRLEAGQTP